MKRLVSSIALAFALLCGTAAFGAVSRFIKVSDHCYYMPLKESGANVAAVVTMDGILLFNPPQEPELSNVVEALKTVSSKTVRWVVFSEPALFRNAGDSLFAEQNPLILTCARQKNLASRAANNPDAKAETPSSSWLVFEQQMRLFPSDLEVRLFSVQYRARSGGDIVVYLPAEKVLLVGALYEAARYPDIDPASEGSAIGWFEGMRQVLDAVPILKSAIPQAKANPKLDKDKKPEEFITVLSSRGAPSNLQNMKDLLDSAQKLRSDISRIVRRGRECEEFLKSPSADPYRNYSNLDAFSAQLCAETK